MSKMMRLPIELVEEVQRGNAVLFCGMDLSAAGGLPTAAELAGELAQRAGVGYEPGLSLPEAAQAYELALGRNSLIRYIVERLEVPAGFDPREADVYRLIAALPLDRVITTAWDTLLEQVLARPLDVVVEDEDVAYVDQAHRLLIKLRGTLSRKRSLVLTSDDVDDIFARRPEVLNMVRGLFSTRTVLFLGFDLEDAEFKRLYRDVVRHLGRHQRRAYAVQPAPGSMQERYWASKNVALIAAEPAEFLAALVGEAGDAGKAVTQGAGLGVRPAPAGREEPAGGLAAELYREVREGLLDCAPLKTDASVARLFVDERIRPWQHQVPSAESPAERVEALVDLLHSRYDGDGENALALFVRVAAARLDPGDACHKRLLGLAERVARETQGGRAG